MFKKSEFHECSIEMPSLLYMLILITIIPCSVCYVEKNMNFVYKLLYLSLSLSLSLCLDSSHLFFFLYYLVLKSSMYLLIQILFACSYASI